MPDTPPPRRSESRVWLWLLGLAIGAALVGPTIIYRSTFDPDRGQTKERREDAVYVTHGIIREIDTQGRRLMIAHDEIPGVMPEMTMPFIVRDVSQMEGLAVDDHVELSFQIRERGAWIERIEKEAPDAH